MEFARHVSSHVIFLHQGVIEEEGTPDEVFGHPKSPRLQQFLSGALK
jgi:histidine transport system ATP-binding protein